MKPWFALTPRVMGDLCRALFRCWLRRLESGPALLLPHNRSRLSGRGRSLRFLANVLQISRNGRLLRRRRAPSAARGRCYGVFFVFFFFFNQTNHFAGTESGSPPSPPQVLRGSFLRRLSCLNGFHIQAFPLWKTRDQTSALVNHRGSCTGTPLGCRVRHTPCVRYKPLAGFHQKCPERKRKSCFSNRRRR